MTETLLSQSIDPRQYRRDCLYSFAKAKSINRPSSNLPLASIIILNFNGEDVLKKCLSCICNQDYPNFEIIIIDNASSDISLKFLKEYETLISSFPSITRYTIVPLKENLGVAGGRNAGIKIAKGDILAFIDNDGYADKSWLRNGITELLFDDKIGAIASAVFFNSEPLKLNGAGGILEKNGKAYDAHFQVLFNNQLKSIQTVYPMGCGMILRRNVYDIIFPIEQLFPKWFDDVEIGLRIFSLGKMIYVAPSAIIDHDYRTSDTKLSKNAWKIALMYEKARIRNYLKYFPLSQCFFNLFLEINTIFKLLIKGNWRHSPVLTFALFWNLTKMWSLIPIRKQWALSHKKFNELLNINLNLIKSNYK